MQKDKISIADGYIQTRDNLHGFKTDYNKAHPKDRIRTLADAIDKLIEIATIEVPRLEELVSQRNARIENLEGEIEELENENKQLRMKVEELEDENENLNASIDGMTAFERERAKEVSDGMYKE